MTLEVAGSAGEGILTRSVVQELQNLRLTRVVGINPANTDITVTGIKTTDTLLAVIRLINSATAANLNLTNLTVQTTITEDDTIQISVGTGGQTIFVIYWSKPTVV